MEIFKNPNYDFIGFRRKAFAISGTLILIGILSIIFHGGLRYGIDFTGGTLVQIKLEKPVEIGKIRKLVKQAGIPGAEIQNFGDKSTFLVKYKATIKKDPSELVKFLSEKLNQKVILERTERVGPRVGKELQKKALEAILIGLLLMLIYIWIRFDLKFGVGSVLALFHDVFITVGIFSLLNKEITIPIIAALLTIVGYSINDSIVVSDRIRENMRKYGKIKPKIDKLIETFNRSINDTISRTVITSFTTLLVLIAILIFGGPVIFDFALAITIGVVVGTYSSIYVVASLVVEWEAYLARRKKKK